MNTDQRVYLAGAVGSGASAVGLAQLARREYLRLETLRPDHVHVETEHTAAAIAGVPRTFDDIYIRAQERARGEHVLDISMAVIAAVGCVYLAYRSIRRIFR